jgi:hypothetical protein
MTPPGFSFNAPPGWQVPDGDWTPPEGWAPDPSWPPAPHGVAVLGPQRPAGAAANGCCSSGAAGAINSPCGAGPSRTSADA